MFATEEKESMSVRINPIKNLPLHISLGVQDIKSEDGRGTLVAMAHQGSLNPAGLYHGGIIYMLCDVCAYSGLLSALSDEEDAVTHDIHVSVLRPVKAESEVMYQSSIVKRGRTLCFIDVEASSNGKLIATARVTKSIIKVQ